MVVRFKNYISLIVILILLACNSGSDDSVKDEIITNTPTIIVDKTSIIFDNTMVSKSSASSFVMVESINVNSPLKISSISPFEISFDNINFHNSLSLDANESKSLYVRFSPTQAQTYSGTVEIQNDQAQDVKINLTGQGTQLKFNYKTFSQKRLAWGSGYNQSASQNFDLHDDNSNIEAIKMYVRIECPSVGCDSWDRFANILIKNSDTNQWYEMARHITPYGVGNSQLDRGLEVDVTDFKSMLEGNVELKIFVETWEQGTGWVISVEFDFLDGTPDYEFYQISPVIQFNNNSLGGVPYGGEKKKINGVDVIFSPEEIKAKFDLKKTISFGPNIKSAHFRTIISGWGHATPNDSGGRGCAEWCFRTHKILVDNAEKFSHNMGPLGCASNPINNQGGNWTGDRAGWCPGMIVPVRIDKFNVDLSNDNIDFEYYFVPWVNNFQYSGQNPNAYNAISTFIIIKSDQQIEPATISN